MTFRNREDPRVQWVHTKPREAGPGLHPGVKQSLKEPPNRGEIRVHHLEEQDTRVLVLALLLQSFSRMTKSISPPMKTLSTVGVIHLVLGTLERLM